MSDQPPVQAQQTQKDPESERKLWGMLVHLTSLAGFIGIPFGNIIGPLVIWLIKKDEIPFVDEQGKESLNFQITMTLAGIIAGLLCFVLVGIILLPIVIIASLVLIVMASLKAKEGESYRYPVSIRFLK